MVLNSLFLYSSESNIAFSAGNYPVVSTPTGYKTEINYQAITGE
jgi:hypothetical protein